MTEHIKRRELLDSDMCPKCGTFPQPTWRAAGSKITEIRYHKDSETGLQFKDTLVEREHLQFDCPCGYQWEGPTRDASEND